MGQLYLLCHFFMLPFTGHLSPDTLSYTIIPGIHHTYGYDIVRDGHVLIHQPSVPCKPGLEGFSNEKDAQTVARLVMGKISKGIMPPTVTLEEMKAAGIKFNH